MPAPSVTFFTFGGGAFSRAILVAVVCALESKHKICTIEPKSRVAIIAGNVSVLSPTSGKHRVRQENKPKVYAKGSDVSCFSC